MSRKKGFNDFSYGIGLEYNASSYKQVKDVLKGDLDNLKQLADAYSKMIKIDPNTDLSAMASSIKEINMLISQIKGSQNPFSEFVDKGVLARVATLEQSMQSLITQSAELKNMFSSAFGEIKSIGEQKFPGSFDRIFADKSGEIQSTIEQIKELNKALKKIESDAAKAAGDPADLLFDGKKIGANTSIKTVEKWIAEWESLLQRWNNLDFDGEKGQIQLYNSMQNVASKIYKALEFPKIDTALSSKIDTTELIESLKSTLVDAIDVTITDIRNKKESLEAELSSLKDLQQKYISSNKTSSNASGTDRLDYQAQVNITPKVTPSEWAKIINSKLKAVEDQLDPVVLKPTFSNSSKNLEKDLQGNVAAINHSVKVNLRVEDNLSNFEEKIKNIDTSLANAKAQIEKNAKFKIGFEYEDGQRFKDVAYPIINQFKNVPVTLKLTNAKSFMASINNLRKGMDEKLKNIGSTLDEEKITAKLKDIPINLKINNKDALLADIDNIRAIIDTKVQNIGVNLQIANMPQFLAQAALLGDTVNEYYKKQGISNSGEMGSAVTNSTQKIENLSEAAKKAQEEVKKIKEALKDLTSEDAFHSRTFSELGILTPEGKRKRGSKKQVSDMLKEYDDLEKKLNSSREKLSEIYGGSYQAYDNDIKRKEQLENNLNLILQTQTAYSTHQLELAQKRFEAESKIVQVQTENNGQQNNISITADEANKKYQELNATVQKTKTILDALSSKESLLTNNGKTSYFTKLGEWDNRTNSFKKNTADMEQLLEKYRELHELNQKAGVKSSNNPHVKEELSLRGQINAILRQQKQHVADILLEREKELASVKNILDTYNQVPSNGIKVNTEESKKKIDELNASLQQTKDALTSLKSEKFSSKWFGVFDEKGNLLSGDVKEKVSQLVSEYNNLLPVNKQLEQILQSQITYSSKRVQDLEKELRLQQNVTTEAYKAARAYADTLNLSEKQKEHWSKSMIEKALGNAFGTRADQGNAFYFAKFGSGDKLLQSFINEAKVYDEILQQIGYRLGELKPNIGSDGGQWGFKAEAIAIPGKAIQSYDEAKKILMGVGDSATQTSPKVEELSKKLAAAKEALASLQKDGMKSEWFGKLGNIDSTGNKQQQAISDLIAKSEQLKGTETQLEQIRQNQLKYLNEQKKALEAQIAAERKPASNIGAKNTNTETQINKEKDATQKLNEALGKEHVDAMNRAIASEEEKRKKSVELTKQLSKELEVLRELNKLGASKKGSSGRPKDIDTSVASARIAKEYSKLEQAALNYLGPNAVDKAVVSMKPLKDGIVEVTGVLKGSNDEWKTYTMQIKASGEIDKYKVGCNQAVIKSYLDRGKAAESAAKAESSQDKSSSIKKAEKQLGAIDMLNKRIEEYQSKNGLTFNDGNLNKYIDNLNNVRTELYNALNTPPAQPDSKYDAHLENLVQKAKDAASRIQKELNKSISGDNLSYESKFDEFFNNTKITGPSPVEKFQQMSQAAQDYAKIAGDSTTKIKSFNAENNTLSFSITGADGVVRNFTMSLKDLTGAVDVQEKSTKTLGSAWNQFKASIPRTLSNVFRALIGGTGIYKFISMIREGVKSVKELDAALTELKKVTDETDATYEKFVKTAARTANEIGTTLVEFTEATSDFARLGYSIEDASKLAEAASIYTNIGDGIDNISTATESIISTMKAFGIEAENSMDIVNKFNEVGNNFAISSGGIGDALQRSASALNEAGNTIDESIGLITAANAVVQNPESVGTALKTLSLRLRGAKVELEEAGLETDNMAESTATLRKKLLALTGQKVDIMFDDKTFKNSTQILREMASVWKDMTDINRSAALELMGGKRQANILSAIISNFDVVENVIKTSLESENSALIENAKYMDSVQGRLDKFNNAKQTMWANFISSDLIKNVINFGTTIITFLDKIGAGFTSLISIAGGAALTTLFKGFSNWFKDTQGNLTLVKSLSASFGNLGEVIKSAAFALKGFVMANPILAGVAVALAAITAVTIGVKKAEEEAAKAAVEQSKKVKEANSSLEDYKQQIIDLRYELDYGNLSEEEAYNVRKQLITIQDDLISRYGEEAKAINLVTGEVKNQISAINDLAVANASAWLNENNKKTGWLGLGKSVIQQAKDAVTKPVELAVGDLPNWDKYFKDAFGDEWKTASEEARAELEDFINELGGNLGVGGFSFSNISRDELIENFDKISQWLRDYEKKTAGKLDFDKLIGVIQNAKTEQVGDNYDTHKANFEAYLENTALESYTKEYSAILKAQDEFEKAYASGNYEAIQKANKQLQDAIEQAKTAAGDDEWQVNWFDGLDDQYEQAMSEINFKQAFEDNADGISANLKNTIKNVSAEIGHTITDIELENMVQIAEDDLSSLSPEQASLYELLTECVAKYGLEVQDLISLLVQLGVVQGEVFSTTIASAIKAKSQTLSELTAEVEKYNNAQAISSEIITDNTEITEDQLNTLKEYIEDEELLNQCIDTTNGNIVTNAELLNDLIKKTRKNSAEQVKLARTQAKLKYYKLYKDLVKLTRANKEYAKSNREQSSIIGEQLSLLEKEISKYNLLEQQLLGTTDAFDKFAAAQEIDSENNYIGTVEEMIAAIGEGFGSAKEGTETFQAAIAAIVPKSVYKDLDTLEEKMDAIYEYFKGPISKYFNIEYDDDGKISSVESTLEGTRAFVEEMQKLGIFTGDGFDSFNLADNIFSIEQIEKMSGLTKEIIFAMFKNIEDYDISWLGGDYETLLDALVVTTDEIAASKEKLKEEYGIVDIPVRLVESDKIQGAGYDYNGTDTTVYATTLDGNDYGVEGTIVVNAITPTGEVLSGAALEDYIKEEIGDGKITDSKLYISTYTDLTEAKNAVDTINQYGQQQANYSLENEIYSAMQVATEAYNNWLKTGDDQYWDKYIVSQQALQDLSRLAQQNFEDWTSLNEEYNTAANQLQDLIDRVNDINARVEELNKKKLEGTITAEETTELASYASELEDLSDKIDIAKQKMQELAFQKAGLNEPTELEVTFALDEINRQIEQFKEEHKTFDIEADVEFNEEDQEYSVKTDVEMSDEDRELIEGLLDSKHGLELFLESGDVSTDVENLIDSASELNSTIKELIAAIKGDSDSKKDNELTVSPEKTRTDQFTPSNSDGTQSGGGGGAGGIPVDEPTTAILMPVKDPTKMFADAMRSAELYGDSLRRATSIYDALVEDTERNPLVGRDLLGNLDDMVSLLADLTFNAKQFNDASKIPELKVKVQDLKQLLIDNNYDETTIKTIFSTLGKTVQNSEFSKAILKELTAIDAPIEQTMATLDQLGIEYKTFQDEITGETKISVNDSDLTLLLSLLGISDDKIQQLKDKWATDGLFITSVFDPQGINEAEIGLDNIDGKSAQVAVNAEDNASGPISAAIDKLKEFLGLSSPSVPTSASGGGGGAGGFVNGTAHATGDWGLSKPEHNALVGELGQELVVDPNTGRYYTVGDHGAEMVDLPKDAIIFNHKQTESLLSRGYVAGRGKAYAQGNAHVFTRGAVNTYVKQYVKSKSSGGGSGSGSSNDSEPQESTFDFIEVKMEKIETLIEKITKKIALFLDDTSDINKKDKYYDQLVEAEKNKASTYLSAAEAYNRKAVELLQEVPSKYREMAKNGAIAIEDFIGDDEQEVLDAINNYREYAQKADEAEAGYLESIAQSAAYRVEQLNDIATDFENLTNQIETQSGLVQSQMDLIEESGNIVSEKFYKDLMKKTKEQRSELVREKASLQKILDDAVKSGDVIVGTDEWFEMVQAIYDVDDAIIQCDIDLEKYQNSINDLNWESFERLLDQLDNIDSELSFISDLMTKNDWEVVDENGNWTQKGITAMGMYAQQMEIAQTKVKQYGKEIDELDRMYQKGLISQIEYNEKLAELKDGQRDAINAYEDAKDAIVDLNKVRVDAIKNGLDKELDAYKKLIEKKKEALEADKD